MGKPYRPQDFPEHRNHVVADPDLWYLLPYLDKLMDREDFAHADHIRDEMAEARLWWLGTDACELIEAAWESMPPTTLTRDLAPDPSGFLCFERIHWGIASDRPDPVRVDYLQWFPTRIKGRDALSIVCWQDGITAGREIPYTGPLGRADWLYGDDTDAPLPGLDPAALPSVVEDRRLLACIWQLSSQASITDAVDSDVDRPTRRRLERRRQSVPKVRIINLAHRHRAVSGDPGGHRDVEWTRRWIVSGHWRQQACGPGRTQHRPVYIAPFIKGPEDKPLVTGDSVKVWR